MYAFRSCHGNTPNARWVEHVETHLQVRLKLLDAELLAFCCGVEWYIKGPGVALALPADARFSFFHIGDAWYKGAAVKKKKQQ